MSRKSRRKTVLITKIESPLLDDDDEDDDEITFKCQNEDSDEEFADARSDEYEDVTDGEEEFTDSDLAQKYKELYKLACRQLIEYEDKIEYLEDQLQNKENRGNINVNIKQETVQMKAPVAKAAPIPGRNLGKRPKQNSMITEIQNMKKRLRHHDSPSAKKRTPACAKSENLKNNAGVCVPRCY
jgi:hypothetical protein